MTSSPKPEWHVLRPALSYLMLSALCAASGGELLLAQDAPSTGGLFLDTVDVSVANLEVVVTDESGTPVSGLTADDFEVLVDGEIVELSNFLEVVNRATSKPKDAAAGQDAAFQAGPDTRHLNLVILVDHLNMSPENRNLMLERLDDFLFTKFDRRDQVMLAVVDEPGVVKIAQEFTHDAGLLSMQLHRLAKESGGAARIRGDHQMLLRRLQIAPLATNPGAPTPDNRSQVLDFEDSILGGERMAMDIKALGEARYQRVRATVDAIKSFTGSLAGLRGRKAILFVTDGLPVRAVDSLTQAWLNKYEAWIQVEDASELMDDMMDMLSVGTSSRFDATRHVNDLVASASVNRVAFYPISLGGRLTRSSLSPQFGGAGTATGQGPLSSDVVALEQISREAPLLQMAKETGGIAFTRTANVEELVERVVLDFENFYSLGYLPAGGFDDQVHEIEVRLKVEGLQARFMDSFQRKNPMTQLEDLTLSALHHGLQNNPLDVRLDVGDQVGLKGRKYEVSVMVKIPFRQLLLLPEGDKHRGRASLFVVAQDKKGNVSPVQQIEIPISVPNDRITEALAGVAAYPLQLHLREGPQRLAIGVRDQLGQVDSTVLLEIDVGHQL